jgi:hypothetical protein
MDHGCSRKRLPKKGENLQQDETKVTLQMMKWSVCPREQTLFKKNMRKDWSRGDQISKH